MCPGWRSPPGIPPRPQLCRRLSGRLLWTSVSPPINGWLTRSLRLTPENFRRGHAGGVRSPSRCGLVRFSFLQQDRPRNEESEDLALVSPGRALPVSSLCPFPCVSPCEDRDHVVAHAYSPSDRASGTCPWRFGGTKEGPGQDRVVAAEGVSQVKREGKQWGVGESGGLVHRTSPELSPKEFEFMQHKDHSCSWELRFRLCTLSKRPGHPEPSSVHTWALASPLRMGMVGRGRRGLRGLRGPRFSEVVTPRRSAQVAPPAERFPTWSLGGAVGSRNRRP